MDTTFLIVLGVLLAVGAYFIYVYNRLNTLRVRIRASIQEIGNQLKRQSELIPNLTSSVEGYLKHERGIFEQLTEARKHVSQAVGSGDVDKMVQANTELAQLLPRLQVLVESNPEIRGSSVVQDLMSNLRDTSDKVSYARRLLIDLTADYNTKLVVFPSNIVAKIMGFSAEKGLSTPETGEHVEVSQEETKTPEVKF